MSITITRLAPLAVVLLLAACGGGSGGGELAGPVTEPDLNQPPIVGDEPVSVPEGYPAAQALADGTAHVEVTGASSAEARLVSDDGDLRFAVDGDVFTLANTGRSPETVPKIFEVLYYQGEGVDALAKVEALPGVTPFGDELHPEMGGLVFGAWARPGGVTPGVAGFVAGTATPPGYDLSFAEPDVVLTYRDRGVYAVERGADGEDRFLAGEVRLEYAVDDATIRGQASLFDAETAKPWGTLDTGLMGVQGGPGVAGPFAGSDASTSLGHKGSASGNFFGSDANEVGGVFRLEGPSEVAGAFAGINEVDG